MKFRLFLLAVALFCLSIGSSFADATRKPNVILIMADDFGFECVTANGGQSYRTPNLDRLAATGMRFENCHVQPLCTPTRVQLMTGQYNVRNYVEFGYMLPESRTFANLFHDAGYTTAIAGKWQLGEEPSLPKRWGFDEHCLWQFTRRPERYKNPGLEINGKEMDFNKGEYGPDIICNYAVDFITRHKDKPFLLYYPMLLTHDPFVPTPDNSDYTNEKVKRQGRDTKYFADMVAYADKNVGRLISKLDELKIRENTLVIFLGDNGTHPSVTSKFRGQPYEGGKGKQIQTGSHVPLFVNWPRTIPGGGVNSNIVDSTDIFPTMCEAAGIKTSKERGIDGQSFFRQLKGEKNPAREWSYSWYAPRNNELKFEFARDVNFKLYRQGTLFDLRTDPEEKSPLAETTLSAEAKNARAKLAKVLEKYRNARPAGLTAQKGAKLNNSEDEESDPKAEKRAARKARKAGKI